MENILFMENISYVTDLAIVHPQRRCLGSGSFLNILLFSCLFFSCQSAAQSSQAFSTTGASPAVNVVNVISFGADPTGVKDSAAAVRAAVASIGPVAATLYFPKGTYRFASYGLM